MMKRQIQLLGIVATALLIAPVVIAAESTVPQPFQGSSPDSTYRIKYDDLNDLLKRTVIKTGRSTREVASPTRAKTGTRMKQTVKRATVNEGNRFYYEAFDNERARGVLRYLRKSLETVPDQVPLDMFSRDEQLAFWLNLYNVTLLDEIVQIYPKRNLKKLLQGKNSILDKKTLQVAGVSLSLNDIQNSILMQNYNHNPLILYGLYQGVIGGPNIRKAAYEGSTVYAALEDNAEEFVNSNRGTYADDETTFRASSLYDRDKAWFEGSDDLLKQHLLHYLQSPEKEELTAASRIKANIDDWSVTDLYGSYQEMGASLADNKAALMDSIKNEGIQDTDGGPITISTNFSAASSIAIAKAPDDSRFSPDLLVHLREIDARRMQAAKGDGTVTVEEMGEVPTDQVKQDEKEQDEKARDEKGPDDTGQNPDN